MELGATRLPRPQRRLPGLARGRVLAGSAGTVEFAVVSGWTGGPRATRFEDSNRWVRGRDHRRRWSAGCCSSATGATRFGGMTRALASPRAGRARSCATDRDGSTSLPPGTPGVAAPVRPPRQSVKVPKTSWPWTVRPSKSATFPSAGAAMSPKPSTPTWLARGRDRGAEALQGSGASGGAASLALAASEQVRAIVEAAETSAADIERQAPDEADRIRREAEADARRTRDDAVPRARSTSATSPSRQADAPARRRDGEPSSAP